MNVLSFIPKFSGAAAEPTPADMRTIVDALRHSPEIAAAVERSENQKRARRRELVGLLAKMDADAPGKFAAFDKAIGAARERVQISEKALADARQAAQNAHYAKSGALFEFSREHDALEVELRATANPEIALFITEMRDEWHRTMKIEPELWNERVTNQVTGETSIVSRGRGTAAIVARMAAIREAIATAEELQLEADQSNVSAVLQDLRQNLPAA